MDRKEIMDVLSRSSKYILIAMAALGKANEGILQYGRNLRNGTSEQQRKQMQASIQKNKFYLDNTMSPENCKSCYYRKVRGVDPETGQLSWGPWCLESGQPVRCEKAVEEARCCNGDNS